MKISKSSAEDDGFGNTLHKYFTLLFQAWILETTDNTYFISIFDIDTSEAYYTEEIELNSFNMAYITMYDNLWRLQQEKLPF